jgi:hypothetical protein
MVGFLVLTPDPCPLPGGNEHLRERRTGVLDHLML